MIEFAPFRLDTVNQCLWRRTHTGAEEHVFLPPKAFAVLSFLLGQAGRLVTEDELLHAVWPNTYVQTEVIKSQIYEVRKALGDDANTPRYIQTLPRRGYRFIAAVRQGPAPDFHGHLVGREKALSELLVYLRTATRGERQIVLVTGEAGIGKTALVDLLQHQAALEIPGLRIVRGQCIESYGGTEAYYPMLEALGQWCRDSAATWAVDLLASYAPTWLAQFPELLTRQHREALQQEILGATRGRMLREIAMALDVMTSVSPLLLIFEDLQWVDHSTVDLVSVLARRRASAKLMLIATMRPIDSMPVGHPLRALRKDLLLHRVCHEIDVKPLTEAQIAEYLTAESTPEALPEGLAAFVYRHTEGNPLFMVAALDYLCQRGFISRAGTGWRLATPVEALELGVPDNLRQMIEAQIERLSAQEQHALEAASVAGAMFLASACAVALGADREDIEELYDVLARRHRVVRYIDRQRLPDGSVTSRYDFVHALYREVLYRRQALRHRAKLHRRIGEHLEAIRSQTAQNRS